MKTTAHTRATRATATINAAAVTVTLSATPALVLAAPDQAAILAALPDALNRYMDNDTLKLATAKIITQQTDPDDSAGDYIYSDITLDTTLTFTRSVITTDRKTVTPTPAIGDAPPYPIAHAIAEALRRSDKATVEKTYLTWDAEQTLSFIVEMRYRRAKTDTQWPQPTVQAVRFAQTPTTTPQTLRIRYKLDAAGKSVVSEITVEEKIPQ
jgi:hypothetical protein